MRENILLMLAVILTCGLMLTACTDNIDQWADAERNQLFRWLQNIGFDPSQQ